MGPSDSDALGPVTAIRSGFSVRGGLARSGGIWGRWDLFGPWRDRPIAGRRNLAIQVSTEAMTLVIDTSVVVARFSEHAAAATVPPRVNPWTYAGEPIS